MVGPFAERNGSVGGEFYIPINVRPSFRINLFNLLTFKPRKPGSLKDKAR